MMRRLFVFLQFLLLCAAPSVAAPMPEGRNTAISLVADSETAVPGQVLTLGIAIDIRDHWHTYWENPGDSGDVLRVKWDLPTGVTATPFQWPAPSRLAFGPLLNFGYEHQVTILTSITVPDDFAETTLAIKGRAEVLVCEEICIPEFQDLALALPVSTIATPANQELFATARAALPQKREGDFAWSVSDTHFEWRGVLGDFKPVALFPTEWGVIDNPSKQSVKRDGDETVITVPKGTRNVDALSDLRFVLTDADGKGIEVVAAKAAAAPMPHAAPESVDIWQAILFALLGGLILNLMPCVFPILSMKALKFLKLQDAELREARKAGFAYTLGILVSFGALAALLIALRGAGEAIGWGFQLQSPIIITLLAWIMLAVGFNLLGVFNVAGFANFGAKLTQGSSWLASFFTGVLAAVVATPCTAPFMATALGVALIQPPFVAIAIFLALGLGLALPFLAISLIPAFARALPRPGAWMDVFRQVLAFPMFAASVWLVWIAVAQTGSDGILYIMGGALFVGFLAWSARFRGVRINIMRAMTVAGLVWVLFAMPWAASEKDAMAAEAFTPQKFEEALAGDRPVFVNMTAKWCVTCLVNERVALSNEATQKLFAGRKIVYLKGDWTSYDPAITEFLARYGRQGVPLYLYFPVGDREAPVILPQLLTPAIVADALKE